MLDKSRKIGIVSGIGPLAGADILARIFKHAAQDYLAADDDEYPDVILISHGISGVDYLATLSTEFKDEIIKTSESIITQGANVVGIACNTAHVYLDDIKKPRGVEIVNLLNETAKVASASAENYLLLTSHATWSQRLYHHYLNEFKVQFSEADTSQQEILDKTIALVMAYELDRAGDELMPLLDQAEASDFTGLIVGCTELPIAIAHCSRRYNLKVVESNEVLAKVLTDKCYK